MFFFYPFPIKIDAPQCFFLAQPTPDCPEYILRQASANRSESQQNLKTA
jgi:hypothetical protein